MDLKEIKEWRRKDALFHPDYFLFLLPPDREKIDFLISECERLSEENAALKMEASDVAQALHAMQQNTAQKCVEIAEGYIVGANKFDDPTDRAYDRACLGVAKDIRKEFGL